MFTRYVETFVAIGGFPIEIKTKIRYHKFVVIIILPYKNKLTSCYEIRYISV